MRDSEEQSLGRVVESLAAAFPQLPESHVRDCVLSIHDRFADARIRTYLPILVSRRAQAVLSGIPTTDDVPTRPDPPALPDRGAPVDRPQGEEQPTVTARAEVATAPTEQVGLTVGLPGSEAPEQP